MTPRRLHHLPPNLTLDEGTGRYRYRDPRTGRRTWFGRDRTLAITRAKEANRLLATLQASPGPLERTLADGLDLYLLTLPDKPWGEQTRRNYLAAFRRYRRELGHLYIDQANRVVLGDWLTAASPSADAYNHHRARLIDLWRFLIARNWCNTNEAECTLKRSTSRKLPANRRQRQRLSPEGFRIIHAAAPGWLQIAMEMSLITLQARAEILAMQREHLRAGHLYVIRAKTAASTDMAFLRIAATPAIEALWARAWADGIACPYLIHTRPGSMRPQHLQNKPHWAAVTPDHLTKTFKEIRNALPLFATLPPRQRPTFHEIRSLGARTYLAQGYPREYVRALLGHADPKTTRIYLENPDGLTDQHYREVRADLSGGF